MTVADLERLFGYSYWANKKMFQVVSQLPPEQFTQPVAGAYGSIRNTLVHVMSAEWGWLDRCGGHPRGPALKADDYPTIESVVEEWTRVEVSMREFLATLKDDDMTRIVEFALPGRDKRALPVQSLLQHSVNHAAHHRGQIALLLRSLGHVPGNIDLLIYDFEMAGN